MYAKNIPLFALLATMVSAAATHSSRNAQPRVDHNTKADEAEISVDQLDDWVRAGLTPRNDVDGDGDGQGDVSLDQLPDWTRLPGRLTRRKAIQAHLVLCQPDDNHMDNNLHKVNKNMPWVSKRQWDDQATNFCQDYAGTYVHKSMAKSDSSYVILLTDQKGPKGEESFGKVGYINFFAVNRDAGDSALLDYDTCFTALTKISEEGSKCYGTGHKDVKGGYWETAGGYWDIGGAVHEKKT